MALWIYLIMSALPGVAQEAPLSLQDCYQAAIRHSVWPQLAARDEQAGALRDLVLQNRLKPQITLNGQATWQSETLTFPADLFPGDVPVIPRFQYRATADLSQTLYDGGTVRAARDLNITQTAVTTQQSQLEQDKVRDQVNNLFFPALMLQGQLAIIQNSQQDLVNRRRVIQSGVTNGVLLPGDLLSFDRQAMMLEQQRLQVAAELEGLLQVLAVKMGLPDTARLVLKAPDALQLPPELSPAGSSQLALIDLQDRQLEAARKALEASRLPQAGAFVQAGAGQPHPYNLLNTNLSGFVLAGVRLSWTPFDWESTRKGAEIVDLQREQLALRRTQAEEALLAGGLRQRALIPALDSIIATDDRIISLQQSLVDQTEAQMLAGVRTSADYLKEVSTLTQARLQREVHYIQSLQVRASLLTLYNAWK
ncbi:MAG: TolC family protein [Bacteroidia bacterium]|nr:TolC family protein [Bacteroidia bacterium]